MPSWERSTFALFVAAKTEGEEMGQYVMAVYGQLMASFARAYLTAGCDLVHDARVGGAMQGRACCGCVAFAGARKAQRPRGLL